MGRATAGLGTLANFLTGAANGIHISEGNGVSPEYLIGTPLGVITCRHFVNYLTIKEDRRVQDSSHSIKLGDSVGTISSYHNEYPEDILRKELGKAIVKSGVELAIGFGLGYIANSLRRLF